MSGDDRQSLAGIRVLVGRARHQASALSSGLRGLGAEVLEIPFIEIRPPRSYEPLDTALRNIQQYDWLILTSVNGATAVAERMKQLVLPLSSLASLKVAAIGPSTRKEIELLGVHVDVVPERYVAESVVESLRGKVEGKRVLLARAKVARDVIPSELKKMGAKVDVVEAYETITPESSRKALVTAMSRRNTRPNVLTFTSSSTVRNFVALLGDEFRRVDFGGMQFASIGPITSGTLREVGLPVHIEATEYTIPGLIQAIVAKRQ